MSPLTIISESFPTSLCASLSVLRTPHYPHYLLIYVCMCRYIYLCLTSARIGSSLIYYVSLIPRDDVQHAELGTQTLAEYMGKTVRGKTWTLDSCQTSLTRHWYSRPSLISKAFPSSSLQVFFTSLECCTDSLLAEGILCSMLGTAIDGDDSLKSSSDISFVTFGFLSLRQDLMLSRLAWRPYVDRPGLKVKEVCLSLSNARTPGVYHPHSYLLKDILATTFCWYGTEKQSVPVRNCLISVCVCPSHLSNTVWGRSA